MALRGGGGRVPRFCIHWREGIQNVPIFQGADTQILPNVKNSNGLSKAIEHL